MEWLLAVLAAAAAAAVLLRVARRTRAPRPAPGHPWADDAATGQRVVLDVDTGDPHDPAVQRLVDEVARRTLHLDPDVAAVEVYSRSGTLLGRVERPPPLPEVDLPAQLHEPHVRHGHTPGPVHAEPARHPRRADDLDTAPPLRHRTFADRFELPDDVRTALDDPDSPVEVVRAILATTGREVEERDGVLKVGDSAVVVAPAVRDAEEAALNDAFLRFERSGAARGVVVHLGYVDPATLRRRETAAPHVRHVRTDAIQRMADAAALGADPVTFAIGPQVRR